MPRHWCSPCRGELHEPSATLCRDRRTVFCAGESFASSNPLRRHINCNSLNRNKRSCLRSIISISRPRTFIVHRHFHLLTTPLCLARSLTRAMNFQIEEIFNKPFMIRLSKALRSAIVWWAYPLMVLEAFRSVRLFACLEKPSIDSMQNEWLLSFIAFAIVLRSDSALDKMDSYLHSNSFDSINNLRE